VPPYPARTEVSARSSSPLLPSLLLLLLLAPPTGTLSASTLRSPCSGVPRDTQGQFRAGFPGAGSIRATCTHNSSSTTSQTKRAQAHVESPNQRLAHKACLTASPSWRGSLRPGVRVRGLCVTTAAAHLPDRWPGESRVQVHCPPGVTAGLQGQAKGILHLWTAAEATSSKTQEH
jgi:hypothetical protein